MTDHPIRHAGEIPPPARRGTPVTARRPGRPVDAGRRGRSLTAVVELCLSADPRTLDALTLRAAAEAAGTSARMLVHDFGSRAGMLEAARERAGRWLLDLLAEAETPILDAGGGRRACARARWEQLSSPRGQALLRFTAGRVSVTERTTAPGEAERGVGPATEAGVEDLLVEATLRGLALALAEGAPVDPVERAAAQFLDGL